MIPLPPDNIKCRYTNFKKKCRDLCVDCPSWVQMQGIDPKTGETTDNWNCSDAWNVILLSENIKMQVQTGAAIESFRNEVVTQNNQMLSLASGIPLKLK